jgi:hypothetical protein
MQVAGSSHVPPLKKVACSLPSLDGLVVLRGDQLHPCILGVYWSNQTNNVSRQFEPARLDVWVGPFVSVLLHEAFLSAKPRMKQKLWACTFATHCIVRDWWETECNIPLQLDTANIFSSYLNLSFPIRNQEILELFDLRYGVHCMYVDCLGSNPFSISAPSLKKCAPTIICLENGASQDLKARLLLPSDPEYAAFEDSYWSKTAKVGPACIIRPSSVKEVSESVEALIDSGQRFAIRSGGHEALQNTSFHRTPGPKLIVSEAGS